MASPIQVCRVTEPTDDVAALVAELSEELAANYPPEQRHGLPLSDLFQPHIRFMVATREGEPVGCGGVAFFAGFAELKRMYVRPSARGAGVADAILEALKQEARTAGYSLLRLETGTVQFVAIRFYERSGFRHCGGFPPYDQLPAEHIAGSVFMEQEIL